MTNRPIPNVNEYVPHYIASQGVVRLLDTLYDLFQSTPPLKGPRRFGNLADRSWHDKIHKVIRSLVKDIVKVSNTYANDENLIDELQYYIENSFGSKIRLDYGTGHELSFLAFISSLDMLQLWDNSNGNTGSKQRDPMSHLSDDLIFIWYKYYHLIKSLILTYNLEPAGSHGVWGLDDHFHLIYIWGASQWINDDHDDDDNNEYNTHDSAIRPRDLLIDRRYETFKDKNFFAMAINFICQVKSGPFNEHSPILYDILNTVRSWKKIQRGLLKMYDDEVLNKFPVVQHFWFGDGFFPWRDQVTGKDLPVVESSSSSSSSTTTIGNTAKFSNYDLFTSMPTTSIGPCNDRLLGNRYSSSILSSSSALRNSHMVAGNPSNNRLGETISNRPPFPMTNTVSNATRPYTDVHSRVMGPPNIRSVKTFLPMKHQRGSSKK